MPRAGETLNINSYRRSLERAHLRKMVDMVVRDSKVPEDAQTLLRQGLMRLRGRLQSALYKPGIKMSLETRAHMSESVAGSMRRSRPTMQPTGF